MRVTFKRDRIYFDGVELTDKEAWAIHRRCEALDMMENVESLVGDIDDKYYEETIEECNGKVDELNGMFDETYWEMVQEIASEFEDEEE